MQNILSKFEEYKTIDKSKGYEVPHVQISFDLRGRSSGQAGKRNGKFFMRFNAAIARENLNEFLVRTVPHEIAHILQMTHRPQASRPHGHEWQNFCRILIGKTIPRCHSYEVGHLKRKKAPVKRYLYSCGCKQHQISSIIHGRIIKGRSYFCNSCKRKIVAQSSNILTSQSIHPMLQP